MRRLLVLPVLTLVLLLGGSAAPPRHTGASSSQTLALAVERPKGPAVLLQFELRADTPGEAYATAAAAASELVPGGRIAVPQPGAVTAQWAPWGWTWSNAELPVQVAYNPSGAPPTVGPDAIILALQSWSSVPGSRFAYAYGGFTDRQASLRDAGPDGSNVIAWQYLDCSRACVLGVTSKETVHESDLILNSNPAAGIATGHDDSVDARTVILHETGHMAGLEHSCPAPFGVCSAGEIAAAMFYQYRGVRRKLAADDIAGIVALYPTTAPPPIATPTVSASPSAPPSLEQVLSLAAGWNLTVLPPGPVADSMAALPCAGSVYAYRGTAWQVWIRGVTPQLQTLSDAEAGFAYWVHADSACSEVFR